MRVPFWLLRCLLAGVLVGCGETGAAGGKGGVAGTNPTGGAGGTAGANPAGGAGGSGGTAPVGGTGGLGGAGGTGGTGGVAGASGATMDGGLDAGGGADGDGGVSMATCGGPLGWGPAVFGVLSPDGSTVALASAPSHLEVRRWSDGSVIPISNGIYGVSAVAFSSDGTLLAASAADALRVWRVSDASLLREIPALAGASSISLSSDGAVIAAAVGTTIGKFLIWTAGSSTAPQAIPAGSLAAAVAVSPDGSHVAGMYVAGLHSSQMAEHIAVWAVAGGDASWDVSTPASVSTNPDGSVDARIVFSPDAKTVVHGPFTYDHVGGWPGQFRDASTGAQIQLFQGGEPWTFSSDGAALVGVSVQASVSASALLVRASDGGVVRTTPIPSDSRRPARSWLAAAGFGTGTAVRLVETDATNEQLSFLEDGTTTRTQVVHGLDSDITWVAASADGRWVASSPAVVGPQTTRLWDASTMAQVATWSGAGQVAVAPDGSLLVHVSGTRLRGESLVGTRSNLYDIETNLSAQALAISPSGALLAVGYADHTARLRRASDGTSLFLLSDLQGHTDVVNAVAFSADETMVATGSADKTIRLWNVATGQAIRTLSGSWAILSVAFNSDGSRLVSGDDNGNVHLWNTTDGSVVSMGHAYPAYDLKISPDDSVVYIASSKLLRFHLPDWAPLPSLVGHTGTVTQLALSRDGHRLVSGAGTYTGLVTADGTTRIDCIQ